MASKTRHKNNAINQLQQEAADYEFFQLVRLVERFIADDKHINLQFKASPKLAFPVADIEKLNIEVVDKAMQCQIFTNFMGLIGQSGILPQHYSEYLLSRLQQKDQTLLDFLDIFHDKLLKLFYQAGNLSHFYIDYERQQSHVIPALLMAISGQKSAKDNDAQRYFSGLLSHQVRSPEILSLILQAHFQLPMAISQYTPEWLRLAPDAISYLTKHEHNNRLGCSALLGKKAWHVQNRFSVIIGPVDYQNFLRLLPGGDMLSMLNRFVQHYAGIEFDFDVQLLLNTASLPACQLSSNKQMKLGWNTKLKSKANHDDFIQVKISANKLMRV